MVKALRVTMIVYASLGILFGLSAIFTPRQLGATFGYEEGPAYVAAILTSLGMSMVVAGSFLIIAARDPLKHILFVKYAIMAALLQLAGTIYSFIVGHSNSKQSVVDIIIYAVFAIALLAFYPWRATRIAEKAQIKNQ